MTFVRKTACGYVLVGLEPPSPAAQRCTNGAPDGPDGSGDADRRSRGGRIKSEVNEAGRAKDLGRIQSFLSLRSLKLIVTEEICGRFGSFRWISLLYIALVGFSQQ